MTQPRSLMVRLGLSLGVLLTLIWVAAAMLTAISLREEMDEVFDSALRETAERILPLAVTDIVSREETGVTQRLGALGVHDEFFTYLVRDANGTILLQSHAADPSLFPAYDGRGYRQSTTHRFYNDEAVQGTIRITVSEPLQHRAEAAREIQMGLGLPLLVVLPVALLAIFLVLRTSFEPLRRFRDDLDARSERDLSPVPGDGLPAEVAPMATTLNRLLDRLKEAFEAERNFASNAAHELRTPLAGAIAQAQRLRAESQDEQTRVRAAEIETTLKRLTRLSERLMQLARAEGGRIRLEACNDLRPVARIVIDDLAHVASGQEITLVVAEKPVMSELDPDIFAILCRNLVENALRHGKGGIKVSLSEDGWLSVSNGGPVVPGPVLHSLTDRFERAGAMSGGSGLGLAIVSAIARRLDSHLELASPRPGAADGFQARLRIITPNATT